MFATRFELISSLFTVLSVLEAQTIVYESARNPEFVDDEGAVAQRMLWDAFNSHAGSLVAHLHLLKADKDGHYSNMLNQVRADKDLFNEVHVHKTDDGQEYVYGRNWNPSEVQAAMDTVEHYTYLQAEGNAECPHD